ncbi:MAG: FG-GAP repeat domain-containing protein [Armatimonadota bacterium]
MRTAFKWSLGALMLAGVGTSLTAAQDSFPRFEAQTIDPELSIGYAVTVADMNADGKPDIIAVNENQVRWYQNPTWERHTILSDATPRDNVCIAASDLDGDGRAELALGAFWKPADTVGSGSVHWLVRPEDPRQPWKPVNLEPEPTVHRMRWADVDGDGKQELVMVPLHGRGNQAPEFEGAGVRVVVYRPPANPATDPWTREIADDTLHVTHNLWPVQWDGDRAEEILIAGFEGVFLLDRGPDGKWGRTKLGSGHESPRAPRGSSEIKLGKLPNGKRYLATIEPWHGNEVVVYTEGAGPLWDRRVLDATLRDGHGVWCADVDGKPGDELLIGWRGKDATGKVGVAAYVPTDAAGTAWEKKPIDEDGMACEDLTAADLNGDGRIDLVASGRATRNLKIYWNRP